MITISNCKGCKVEIHRTQSEVNRNEHIFCTRKCYNTIQGPYNKGKTKETDPRIAKQANNASKTLKGRCTNPSCKLMFEEFYVDCKRCGEWFLVGKKNTRTICIQCKEKAQQFIEKQNELRENRKIERDINLETSEIRVGVNNGKVSICEQEPYIGCAVYGPYVRKQDKRQIVRIVIGKKITTSLYSRYLVEIKIGKILPENETVDHIDRDLTNDMIENLRIIDRPTHSKEDIKRVKPVLCKCKLCGKEFYREASQLKSNALFGCSGPYCSRSCSGKAGREIQLGRAEKIAQPIPTPEYYYLEKIIKTT